VSTNTSPPTPEQVTQRLLEARKTNPFAKSILNGRIGARMRTPTTAELLDALERSDKIRFDLKLDRPVDYLNILPARDAKPRHE
jgi:hypothetical protein